jgi:hypothetical protein
MSLHRGTSNIAIIIVVFINIGCVVVVMAIVVVVIIVNEISSVCFYILHVMLIQMITKCTSENT